jgi:hypothetical protein
MELVDTIPAAESAAAEAGTGARAESENRKNKNMNSRIVPGCTNVNTGPGSRQLLFLESGLWPVPTAELVRRCHCGRNFIEERRRKNKHKIADGAVDTGPGPDLCSSG